MITETRTCNCCGKTIRGRTDKKFCDDRCRNNHNNHLNNDSNAVIRQVNIQLRRNRRILEGSLPGGRKSIRTTRYSLFSKGYRFHYFTHTYTDKMGKLFHCCYEFAYTLLANEQVMVTRHIKTEEDEL